MVVATFNTRLFACYQQIIANCHAQECDGGISVCMGEMTSSQLTEMGSLWVVLRKEEVRRPICMQR